MPEFAPTQKLDMAGIVVRKKMAKQNQLTKEELAKSGLSLRDYMNAKLGKKRRN